MSGGSSKPTLLKVVILGDGSVGKTSIMNRFVSNTYDSEPGHTIGVEFLRKDIVVNNQDFILQIWDTAGQERFKSLRTPFYRGADCCLLTYAINDVHSFRNLSVWKKEFIYYADVKYPEQFPFVVLGNKVDLGETDRQVTLDDVGVWARDNGGHQFYETSAKHAINVDKAFESAINSYLDLEACLDAKRDLTLTVQLHSTRLKRSKKQCCP